MQAIGEGVQGVADVLSGNYFAGILRIIEAIEGFQRARKEMKQELAGAKEEAHVAALNHEVEKLNRALDEHIYLLSLLSGEEWLAGAHQSMDLLKDKIKQRNEDIRDLQLRITAPMGGVRNPNEDIWTDFQSAKPLILAEFGVGIDELENSQIQEFLDKYWDQLLPGPRDEIQKYLDEIKEAERAIIDLQNNIKAELTGTTYESIVDTIAQGFEDGKRSIEDFADSFEDIMRRAILQTFERQFLASQLQDWYDQLAAFLDNEATGPMAHISGEKGELTEVEMDMLSQSMEGILGPASAAFEALTERYPNLFGGGGAGTGDPNSLTGAVRRDITEETGSLLAGKMNMMVMDMRELKLIQHEAADSLLKIEQNTSFCSYLARLDQISQDLSSLRNQMLG